MLEVLPLSPVREWAISRSFIASAPHKAELRPGEFARQQHGGHGNDITRRFESAAAGGGAIGVERLDLVADSSRLAQIFGAPGDPDAHLIRFVCARGNLGAVQ